MLNPGTLLSQRYEIQSVLGQGGMGAVYLATHQALGGKRVAVKEMELKGLSKQELEQAVKQFNKEASLLANLDHPNLVQVTDYFGESGKHYLVMAYVKGETLQQKLKKHGRPFTWDVVKKYTEPLVEVLHYIHTQDPPILFRDLKPSNIMIEDSGRLRLIDFGIARTAQAGDKTSTFLQGTGTSGFSPIEQYGGGQSTDQRSDIYALGATMYYLLTGKIPPDAVARISQGKELIPPSKLHPGLPSGVDDLIVNSLGLRQQERQSTMAEFRQQMLAIQSGMDMEGATEDFGSLPAVGASTKQTPDTRTAPPESSQQKQASQAIIVETFPTAHNQPKQNNTPWLVGLGSMAVAAIAIVSMIVNNIPKDPTASPSPGNNDAAISRSVDASTQPKATMGSHATSKVETVELKPTKVIRSTKTKPKKNYIDTSKPLVIKKKPNPKVSQLKPNKKKPTTKSYPTAKKSYPTAKKSYPTAKKTTAPAAQPKPAVRTEQPVATARPKRPNPAGQRPRFPQPPPGHPPPPVDANGNPLPPHMWRPGANGPGGARPGGAGKKPGGSMW